MQPPTNDVEAKAALDAAETLRKENRMDVEKLKAWSRENRDLAMTVCKAKAFAAVERERVDAYIVPIFQRYAFTDDLEDRREERQASRIAAGRAKRVLTDPKQLYLSEDEERCAAYYAECDRAHREHGYKGEEGTCPALVAEARRDLEAMDLASKASHAIGFICGVAAGLDITPLTLIDLVVRSWPPQQAPKKRTKRQR